MSHIVEEKTAITNPDVNLLTQAVQIVAGQHQGTIETFYWDFGRYNQQHDCLFALHTQVIRRGIGIKLDETGTLAFVGDSYGYESQYQEVKQQIQQTYVSLGYMQALQTVGYTAQATEGEAGQVIIQGVQYA